METREPDALFFCFWTDCQTGRRSFLESGMTSTVPSTRASAAISLAYSTSVEVRSLKKESSESFFRSCSRSWEKMKV